MQEHPPCRAYTFLQEEKVRVNSSPFQTRLLLLVWCFLVHPWSIETCHETNDTLSSKISFLYQSTKSWMYFSVQAVKQFQGKEAVLYYPQEICCLWPSEWKIARKSDARFCSANLDNAFWKSKYSWDELACNSDWGKSEKLGVPIFRHFDVSNFLRGAHTLFRTWRFLMHDRNGGSWTSVIQASLLFGLPTRLNVRWRLKCDFFLSWSFLNETGVKGM